MRMKKKKRYSIPTGRIGYFRSKRVNILTVKKKNNIPFKVYLLLIFANRFDINGFIWSNRGQDGY